MIRSGAPQQSGSAVSSSATTRLSGSRLILARAVWLALVVLSLGLFVAGIPVYYAQLQRPCVNAATCTLLGTLTAKGLQDLHAIDFSISVYAILITIFLTVIVAIWSTIGFVIFWRRSDDPFALLTAFALVIFNPTYPGAASSALVLVNPAFNVPLGFVSFLGPLSIGLFLLLFPNGRLVPRWTRVLLLIPIIQAISGAFPAASPFNENNWPGLLSALTDTSLYVAVIILQIYRYRRVSTSVERQQTKWAVLGISIVLLGLITFALLFNGVLSGTQPNTPASLILDIAYPLLFLLLPISIGIAILRSRLYNIDVLINRTLVYGTLTILLALVYLGLVIVLQALVRLLTGQILQSQIVLVASTLAIAALFQPLRRRLQTIMDRRFYRVKYDAQKILAAFSDTLRNEVDLEQLREQLLNVVEETMQPAHVSLWLRKAEQLRKPNADM